MSAPPPEGTREYDLYVCNTVKLHIMGAWVQREDLLPRLVFKSDCTQCNMHMLRDETDPAAPITNGFAYQMRCPDKYTPANPPNVEEVYY